MGGAHVDSSLRPTLRHMCRLKEGQLMVGLGRCTPLPHAWGIYAEMVVLAGQPPTVGDLCLSSPHWSECRLPHEATEPDIQPGLCRSGPFRVVRTASLGMGFSDLQEGPNCLCPQMRLWRIEWWPGQTTPARLPPTPPHHPWARCRGRNPDISGIQHCSCEVIRKP